MHVRAIRVNPCIRPSPSRVSPLREGNPRRTRPRTGTTEPLLTRCLSSSSQCAPHSAPVSRCDPFRLVSPFKVAGASSGPLFHAWRPSIHRYPSVRFFPRWRFVAPAGETCKLFVADFASMSSGWLSFGSTERECGSILGSIKTVLPCWRFLSLSLSLYLSASCHAERASLSVRNHLRL